MRNNDPYLHEDCDVLINRLGIKDHDKLEQYEADSVTARMIVLKKKGFPINSIFDIQAIHNFIFGHVFDWAGQVRTITMYKRGRILGGYSVDYSPAGYIVEDLEALDKKFKNIPWSELTNDEKVLFVTDIIQELWQIHSFREGNTRTTALFLYFLMKQIGLNVNSEFLGKNAMYFRNALVLASIGFRSKKEYLIGIILDASSYHDSNDDKYKTIEGIDCEKYDYRPHTIEKLKTITCLADLEK